LPRQTGSPDSPSETAARRPLRVPRRLHRDACLHACCLDLGWWRPVWWWGSDRRRADSLSRCRPWGLTGFRCVARRRSGMSRR